MTYTVVTEHPMTSTFGLELHPTITPRFTDATNQTNTVVDNVLSRLTGLSGTVDTNLKLASQAIDDLGNITFTSPNIAFTQPQFQVANTTDVPAYEPGAMPQTPATAPDLTFGMTISTQLVPDFVEAVIPPVSAIDEIDVEPPTVNAAPTKQDINLTPVAAAPAINIPAFVSNVNAVVPNLQSINIVDISLPDVPTYEPIEITDELPEAPQVVPSINFGQYQLRIPQRITELDTMLHDHGLPSIDAAVLAHVRRSLEAIDTAQSNVQDYIVSRGLYVEPETMQTVFDFMNANTGLAHSTVLRDNVVQLEVWVNEALNLAVQLGAESEAFMIDLHIAYFKSLFDIELLKAEAASELARAYVAYYNGQITRLEIEATVYRAEVEAELLPLYEYEALVDVEKSKASINTALAEQYDALVQAETIDADLYAAKITAVSARIDAYKAKMETARMSAEAAKARITAYSAEVDAYKARLSGYKVEFDRYEADTKRVSAINAARSITVRSGGIAADIAGLVAQSEATNLEADAANFKALAQQKAADNEILIVKNGIDEVEALIAQTLYSAETSTWSAERKAEAVNSASIADKASMMAKYFDKASGSATRASEAVQRAAISAANAAVDAATAAGKAAAAVAQGAYAGVRIAAGITGNGSASYGNQASYSEGGSYTHSHTNSSSIFKNASQT